MKILYDFQAFEFQNFGGISKLYSEVIPLFSQVTSQLGLKESDNVHLRNLHLDNIVRPKNYLHKRLFQEKKFLGQRTLANFIFSIIGHKNYCLDINKEYCVKLLKENQFDIFEPTFFDDYFLPFLKGKPFVMAVHDMIPELYPQYFKRYDFQIIKKSILCPLAEHIHVPSNKTKEDLVNILRIPPEKITVISRGTTQLPLCNLDPFFSFPYLLYVGARWKYKNFEPLLAEFCKVADDYDIHLVCTGTDFDETERILINRLGLGRNVHHCFATQETFASLYHNALAFVYPSEYEGFGLPILEAFHCGCPVMLNNTSCFPEVAGDAAIYFEMKNGKSNFCEKLKYLYLLPNDDRMALIQKGYERLKLYSWKETAKKMEDIYHRIG